jgi:hypothetical protein
MADSTCGVRDGVSGEVRETVHDAIGAYVVDALEPEERTDFEAHLSACPQCQDELVEFRETTVELTRLVAARPPQAVRADVLHRVSTTERDPHLEAPPASVAPLDEHPSIMPWDLPSRSAQDPEVARRRTTGQDR